MKGVKGKGGLTGQREERPLPPPQSQNHANIFAVHCTLHRVATSSCRGRVDKLATEPFLLLHCEHGTGYWQSWNCYCRWTCFVVIWKHFCFILSMGTRIRTDSVMRPRSSSRGAIQVLQLQLQKDRNTALSANKCDFSLCLKVRQIG